MNLSMDVFRLTVVRRSTRWTCAATLLPFRSSSSTGTRPLQCQWSSLCHLLRSSVQLHLVLLPACTGSPSHRPVTPPPPPLPRPTGARTLSAQTTRWCYQSTMKCWLLHPPLLTPRSVRIRFSLVNQYYSLFFPEAPSGYLEMSKL